MINYKMRNCNEEEANLIIDKLVEYNLSIVPGKLETDFLWINRVVEDDKNDIIACILSIMYCWNCLYIDTLWVNEKYRKFGLGTSLLRECEQIAIERGCHLIHLDTFDFQAKDFYIKNGYQ